MLKEVITKKKTRGEEIVEQMANTEIKGDLIALSWLKELSNKRGYANVYAALLLAEIVYWFRPNTKTGKKKFHRHTLYLSYKDLERRLGMSKDAASAAFDYLKKKGLIEWEFSKNKQDRNWRYVYLNVEALNAINYDIDELDEEELEYMQEEDENDTDDDLDNDSEEEIVVHASEEEPADDISKSEMPFNSEHKMDDIDTVRDQIDYCRLKRELWSETKLDLMVKLILDVKNSTKETIRYGMKDFNGDEFRRRMIKFNYANASQVMEEIGNDSGFEGQLPTYMYNSEGFIKKNEERKKHKTPFHNIDMTHDYDYYDHEKKLLDDSHREAQRYEGGL